MVIVPEWRIHVIKTHRRRQSTLTKLRLLFQPVSSLPISSYACTPDRNLSVPLAVRLPHSLGVGVYSYPCPIPSSYATSATKTTKGKFKNLLELKWENWSKISLKFISVEKTTKKLTQDREDEKTKLFWRSKKRIEINLLLNMRSHAQNRNVYEREKLIRIRKFLSHIPSKITERFSQLIPRKMVYLTELIEGNMKMLRPIELSL